MIPVGEQSINLAPGPEIERAVSQSKGYYNIISYNHVVYICTYILLMDHASILICWVKIKEHLSLPIAFHDGEDI